MFNNYRSTLRAAALMGMSGVILGAFGAHALRNVLAPERLLTYQTGITYQFYHTFALMAVALWQRSAPDESSLRRIALLFMVGTLCFSGSIYLLAFRDLWQLPEAFVKILGPITPIGGTLFIAAWAMLAFAGLNKLPKGDA